MGNGQLADFPMLCCVFSSIGGINPVDNSARCRANSEGWTATMTSMKGGSGASVGSGGTSRIKHLAQLSNDKTLAGRFPLTIWDLI